MESFISREVVRAKNEATFLDRPFLKHLVREITSIDPDIGAFIIPQTKIVIFVSHTYGIVVYKIRMNEDNIEKIGLEKHKEEVRKIMGFLNSGQLPYRDLQNLKNSAKRLNLKVAKAITI